MPYNLRNRSFLKLLDFSKRDLNHILNLARDLKRAKYAGFEVQRLRGRNIALIFEKTSTRTRCAFEVAAYDQGAHVTYLGPSGSHIGYKETMKDTARVLGRTYDGIEYRGFGQERVEELGREHPLTRGRIELVEGGYLLEAVDSRGRKGALSFDLVAGGEPPLKVLLRHPD